MMRARAIAVVLVLCGCAEEGSSGAGAELELTAPPRASFRAVADALQPKCGTLDCHGQPGRNLRTFGARGLRLRPNERGRATEEPTTDEEYAATYWSVVGLEPETLTAVVRDKGARPERLSLFRKARGRERHKGGTVMTVNDELDRCLLTWIKGNVDAQACQAVAETPRPRALP